MTVKVSYLGTLDDDIAREQERMASLQRYKQKQCDRCIIDYKKSTYPENKKDFFGANYIKSGKIVMKNGEEYEWHISKKGWVIENWWYGEPYESWDFMIEELKQRCSDKYCKQ